MDPVKFIAVDVEEVGNIGPFTRELHKSVKMNSAYTKEQKEEMFAALYHFMKEFFDSNNEKVRVHPKNEPNRKMDYYEEITASFPESTRIFDTEIATKKQSVTERKITEEEKKTADDWYRQGWKHYQEGKYHEAFELFMKAANLGHHHSQSKVAYCYYTGEGTELDYEQAAKWYQKSADQGHANAQYGLGCCYYNGIGVVRDYQKAFEYYEKAAKQDNAGSIYSLGLCYYYGNGVAQNYELAYAYFKKAALKGHVSAFEGLGACYYSGCGVKKDLSVSAEWYKKAADQGSESAKIMYERCLKQM